METLITSWKERLPEILRGYDKGLGDVINLDETGCFGEHYLIVDSVRRVSNVRVRRRVNAGSL